VPQKNIQKSLDSLSKKFIKFLSERNDSENTTHAALAAGSVEDFEAKL